MLEDLERLPTNDAELRVLIDASESQAALLSPGEVRAILQTWKSCAGLRERTRIAIDAPSDLVYGLTRMAQAFGGNASEGRFEVFPRQGRRQGLAARRPYCSSPNQTPVPRAVG
jgi:hypothetical protein